MVLEEKIKNKIAIVEDNEALCQVLAEFLETEGYEVVKYFSAEEMPKSFDFNLAILDLNLPGEDGLSLAARIRSADKGIRVILMTVRTALSDKLKGYEQGADIFLSKPVDPAELLAVTASLFNRLRAEVDKELSKPLPILTIKETNLLKCFAEGLAYAEVAIRLGISVSTVQSHTRSLYSKLGAHSKIEALNIARGLGLL